MMMFIAGVASCMVLIVLCGLSYYLGTKNAHRAIVEPVGKDKAKEQAEKAEAMQKILNYDIGMAYKAKRGE